MSIKDLISPFYVWKRAFEKPITVRKPVEEREGAKAYRGFHVNNLEKCIGCGSCEAICQNAAIDMAAPEGIEPGKGDSGLRPMVDYGRCCWCALCVDVCPTGSLGLTNTYIWSDEDGDAFRYRPGVDAKPWDDAKKGYRRTPESWIVTPDRHPMPEMEPDDRKKVFDEFATGFTPDVAMAEAERCLDCGLCVEACPTHMDVPEYIRAIRNGEMDEALRILFDTNPFSEACGRICTARCENVCAVGHLGEPIAIRSLKRYITDSTADRKDEILRLKDVPETGKKVAIIGGGPGGLTAAFYLRRWGHAVTVFERHDRLGGMLKFGIPDYRLPNYSLGRETDFIVKQGVEIRYNTEIGKDVALEDIKRDFDAILLAIGAQRGTSMSIEGEDNDGVLIGVDILDRIAAGERPDLGRSVMVVGGGNTAMDCCRSSVRLGARVMCLYRRTEKEMPANVEEIREAKEEGVEFRFLAAPVKIERSGDHLDVHCIKMELGEPDASGRRRPVPIEGSEYIEQIDTCIMAIGQKVSGGFGESIGLELTRWGTFVADENSQLTNVPGVFAAGDCYTGPDDAIKAIADGKKSAYSIHEFLTGKSPEPRK